MKFTGISRPIDELGRIVIPKEIRTVLSISPKDEIEIYIEDGNMILKKAKPSCAVCGAFDGLIPLGEKYICKSCAERAGRIVNKQENV